MHETPLDAAAAYSFGPFRLDIGTRKLWQGEHQIPLSGRVCEALLVLLRYRDRVVTKDELVKAIWPDSFVSDDSLTQCIWSVRRVLGDDASQPQFVVTVPRQGYRFVAPVTVAPTSEATTEPPSQPPPGDPAVAPAGASAAAVVPWMRWRRRQKIATAIAATLLGWMLVWGMMSLAKSRSSSATLGPIRTVLDTPAGTRLLADAVLSPDSRQVTFTAQEEDTGRTRLWVRTLSSSATRPLTGTEGASRPFWAPDSKAVGFFANGRLKIVRLDATDARVLADVGLNPGGGSWNRESGILFAGSHSGLQLVSENGGVTESITTLEDQRGDMGHRWPQFLPDGRHFIFTIISSDNRRTGTYLGSLSGAPPTRLFETPNTFATYVESGHLLYVRDDTLLAQPFDVTTLRPHGAGHTIASNVSTPTVVNNVAISATAGGLLTLRNGHAGGWLAWFDRQGVRLGTVDTPVSLHNLSLSPDGRELLADTNTQSNGVLDGVWRLDLARGTKTRLGPGSLPLWSPDGRKIAFAAAKRSEPDIYLASAAFGADDELLLETPDAKALSDWSRDGRYIVYRSKQSLWMLPLFGQKRPLPFVETPFMEVQPRISPNGRWLAYTSNESGRWEVLVRSFPAPGTKYVVSTAGGAEPLWRADGQELFFVTLNNTLMSAAVTQGATWQHAEPRPLFTAPLYGDWTLFRSRYQVTADGNRILMDVTDDSKAQDVVLLINWLAAFSE